MSNIKKVELLSPCGEFDSLKSAITFGADAVYLADKNFGMRTSSKNFDHKQLVEAVQWAHKNNAKIYIAANIVPANEEIDNLKKYFSYLQDIKADAVIVSDIGLLELARNCAPALDIHISTQAGVTNYYTANQLHKLGASRVVLARELSLQDIANLKKKISAELEIETFIHGAMCMSFSGRCLLAQYLTGRDANHGDCPQACRWEYKIIETKRDNIPIDVIEDEFGTTIMNAQDLSMIEHVDDLIEAGIDSLKIEGRSKSAYYSGVITNAYKTAIKAYYSGKKTPKWANQEVHNVSHRPYSTGFYYSDNMSKGRRNSPWQTYEKGYIRNYQLLANVVKNSKIINKTSRIAVETRNYFKLNSQIEILSPGKVPQTAKIIKILDKNNQNLPFSNKPMVQLNLILDKNLTIPIGSFIRQAL